MFQHEFCEAIVCNTVCISSAKPEIDYIDVHGFDPVCLLVYCSWITL